MTIPTINPDRLWNDIEALSGITDPERPWTRRSFSPLFSEGRAWLGRRFGEAGLEVSIDPAGNLLGRRPGRNNALPPILSGSHSDTVPSGGRFDGILGVLCALEVARAMDEAGYIMHRAFEVVDFLAEEPSEFGVSCIGSRAFAGALDSAMLARTRADGTTLAQAIRSVGGDPDNIPDARRAAGSISGYLEVHIEQGPVLENAGIPIGIVSGISGIRRDELVFTGRADHSGTTPMNARADALVAAATFVELVHSRALEKTSEGAEIVATVGRLDVQPNAANAVPGEVTLTLEVRSPETDLIDQFCRELMAEGQAVANRFGIFQNTKQISSVPPTRCDDAIISAIQVAADACGYSSRTLPSGAGHDAVFAAASGPVGMVFVPCREGRSHSPDEWADPEACAAGANTLLQTLIMLDEVPS